MFWFESEDFGREVSDESKLENKLDDVKELRKYLMIYYYSNWRWNPPRRFGAVFKAGNDEEAVIFAILYLQTGEILRDSVLDKLLEIDNVNEEVTYLKMVHFDHYDAKKDYKIPKYNEIRKKCYKTEFEYAGLINEWLEFFFHRWWIK